VEKFPLLEYPNSRAISEIDFLVLSKDLQAIFIFARLMYLLGVSLYMDLNFLSN